MSSQTHTDMSSSHSLLVVTVLYFLANDFKASFACLKNDWFHFSHTDCQAWSFQSVGPSQWVKSTPQAEIKQGNPLSLHLGVSQLRWMDRPPPTPKQTVAKQPLNCSFAVGTKNVQCKRTSKPVESSLKKNEILIHTTTYYCKIRITNALSMKPT